VGLEHALLSQVGEELATGNELHEHVEIARVLGESVEVDLRGEGCTTKG
jgi:hypothetical protein